MFTSYSLQTSNVDVTTSVSQRWQSFRRFYSHVCIPKPMAEKFLSKSSSQLCLSRGYNLVSRILRPKAKGDKCHMLISMTGLNQKLKQAVDYMQICNYKFLVIKVPDSEVFQFSS
jgi:hypothetical protein